MFTGLVEALGTVRSVAVDGPGQRLVISEPSIATELPLGASLAVNGVCLTVIERMENTFTFAAGPETLRLTNLGELRSGDRVNLERALRLGDRLGGHIVQGHVDGLGQITRRELQGEWETVWFSCPPLLTQEMVRKGSIAVDGVSLTLVEVGPDCFNVALIPHTLAMTTLGFKKVGEAVNLETDVFGKYAAKLWKQSVLPA